MWGSKFQKMIELLKNKQNIKRCVIKNKKKKIKIKFFVNEIQCYAPKIKKKRKK